MVFVLDPPEEVPIAQALVVGLVGLYNMAPVLWRVNPAAYRTLVAWLTPGIDALLGIVLVLMTNGRGSPFLIYSLAPILTASLLMDPRNALTVAAASGLAIPGAYVVSRVGIGRFPRVLSGNYLAQSPEPRAASHAVGGPRMETQRTLKEREILQHVSRGLSNAQVAGSLVSPTGWPVFHRVWPSSNGPGGYQLKA